MDTEKGIYETDTQILSLAGSGNICLCDDYRYFIEINYIIYPSIRHAVLSWKTTDVELKNKISMTLLPADLKTLEQSIPVTYHLWSKNFILSLYNKYTFQKFNDSSAPLFAEVLLATNHKEIIAGLMKGQALFTIDEIADVHNYEGALLMTARDFLHTKKACTLL